MHIVFKDNKMLPYLADKDGKGTEQGMVLLFKNGFSSANINFSVSDDSEYMTEGFCWNDILASALQTSYPKITRIFGNANGVYSLNFGRPGVAYNSDEATLINPDSTNGDETIYSRFWKAYINDIFNQNNKILTCYVNLSLSDIYSNMFKKFIYINNTVWVLDKIHNFNPVGRGLTRVTLVKVQDVENYANGQNY